MKIKRISYITPLITGILGAFGGADHTSKSWRRVGIPITLAGVSWLNGYGLISLILGLFGICFSIGYGIPNPNTGDKGSGIGAFWYKLFKGNHFLADLFTRGTVGISFGIIAGIYGLIKGNGLFSFIALPAGIIAGSSSLLFRKLGSFKLLGKQLTWDELGVNGLLGITALLQILK